MLRRIDRNWWTAFGFFAAAVAISCCMTLYRASVEEARYRELFSIIVTPHLAPSASGDPVEALDLRPLHI
jgi:hypothetical protein